MRFDSVSDTGTWYTHQDFSTSASGTEAKSPQRPALPGRGTSSRQARCVLRSHHGYVHLGPPSLLGCAPNLGRWRTVRTPDLQSSRRDDEHFYAANANETSSTQKTKPASMTPLRRVLFSTQAQEFASVTSLDSAARRQTAWAKFPMCTHPLRRTSRRLLVSALASACITVFPFQRTFEMLMSRKQEG